MENKMKYKMLLGLMLSSFVSANSFAMEINGGKLIGHKEWTNGNVISSSFNESKEKLSLPALRPAGNDESSWIITQNDAFSLQRKSVAINTDVTFFGNNLIYIINNETVQKTYIINSNLYIQPPCKGHDTCPLTSASAQNTVILDPHGMMSVSLVPTLITQFSVHGTAKYWVMADVTASDSSIHYSSISLQGSIKVTDSAK